MPTWCFFILAINAMSYGWKGINQGSKKLSCETGNSCKTRKIPVKQEVGKIRSAAIRLSYPKILRRSWLAKSAF